MSDIVERLLAQANGAYLTNSASPVTQDQLEAADTITTLRADLQKLNERNAEYIGTIDRLRRWVAETDVEIERLSEANTQVWAYNEKLRVVLEPLACTCPAKHQAECSRSEVDCPFWNARAALTQEKPND